MSEYYDVETTVTEEITYMSRSKDLSSSKYPGGILEFKKRVEEDAKERLRKAGVEHYNVKVQVFLHEATPPAKPVPCPFCGAKTELVEREQTVSVDGKTANWYRIAHVTPDVDSTCPLAFASKPIYMDHMTPEEAVENWNRWCEHVKA